MEDRDFMQNTLSGAHNQGNNHTSNTKTDVAQGLRALFVNELKDIYWAENALTKAIPAMIQNATSEELVERLRIIWWRPKHMSAVWKKFFRWSMKRWRLKNARPWPVW